MTGAWGTDRWTAAERRAAAAAVAVLAAVVMVDVAADAIVLLSLQVLAPLIAALACRPRVVATIGALAMTTTLVMGAVDSLWMSERHIVALVVVAAGTLVGVLAARSRWTVHELREHEARGYARVTLLDRSSRLIAAPMDFDARLVELGRLVVPDLADLSVIDVAGSDGALGGGLVAADDPEVADLVRRVRRDWPLDATGSHPVASVLRSGEPQLLEEMSDEQLEEFAASPEHLELMRRLRYRSAVVVPLIARGATLGVLSVLRLGNPTPFEAADLSLLTDLASRAALAIDNARLFEERAAAEARLQAIVDTLAEPVTIVDRDGELVYVNEAAAEMLGYASPAEVLERSLGEVSAQHELLDEEGAPLDRAVLPGTRALAGQDPEPITIRRRRRDTGEERWLRVKASVIPDGVTGEPALAVNVVEDVTEERRAHAAEAFLSEASKLLAASLDVEATLRAVAEAAVPRIADGCAIELLDEEGSLLTVALAAEDERHKAAAAALRREYATERPLETQLVPLVPVDDVAVDERHRELLGELELTSVLRVPLVAAEQQLGMIALITTGGRRRLGEADLELALELGRRAGVAVALARIHEERSLIASTLQRSLLPPRLPVVPGVTLAARFRAAGEANQVGGDFYDLFPLAEGWMVVIGDVTGKGPGAAAITSLARYTIRTAAMYEPDPAAVMARLNEILLADAEHPQMCTAACLRVLPGGGAAPTTVELVCAGHPPPFLLRASGELEELCRPGPLLGAFAESTWEADALTLAPGDGIVLYTDGVTDAQGATDRFGQDRLEAVLRSCGGLDADAIAAALDEALFSFQTGPQRDDVALLVLRAAGGAAGEGVSAVVAGSSPALS